MLYAQNAENFSRITSFCNDDAASLAPYVEFCEKLSAVYSFMIAAGRKEKVPSFPVVNFLSQDAGKKFQRAQSQATVTAVFECDFENHVNKDSTFLCFRDVQACDTQFQCVEMHDAGKSFDAQASDNVFTAQITVPENTYLEFFFAKSYVQVGKTKKFTRFVRSHAFEPYVRMRYSYTQ